MDTTLATLKALAHPDRLRTLALLAEGELTVGELTEALQVSQPRVTQYITALEAVGLVERLREGTWVFSRLRRGGEGAQALLATTLASLPRGDARLAADRDRLAAVRAHRAEDAARFFAAVANDRGQLGDEYLPQGEVEAAVLDVLGNEPIGTLVDLGTGTGRMLTLLAGRVERGTGLDSSAEMLRVARHRVGGLPHLDVRKGDLRDTGLASGEADLVSLHQVLHYLDEPGEALREAARLLAPGGRLLAVDFDAHSREEFRDRYNHRRLGFGEAEFAGALADAGFKAPSVRRVSAEGRPDVLVWLSQRRGDQGQHDQGQHDQSRNDQRRTA